MKLQLKKPLIFLDVEATGLNLTKDRMVELGLMRLNPDGTTENKSWRFNPEMPMPPKIARLIGITDEDLAGAPLFKSAAHDILQFLGSADLGGFNPFKLDLPLLVEEFLRAGLDFDYSKRKVIDVQRIFHTMEKRNLAAAYAFYCDKQLDGEHTAMADTLATYEVFMAQLDRYDELGDNLDSVNKLSGSPSSQILDIVGRIVLGDSGEPEFNFGKYRGQKVAEVLRRDPGYYTWMMNGDFTQFTKKKLTEIKLSLR